MPRLRLNKYPVLITRNILTIKMVIVPYYF
jgi:hypothetical protein